MKILKLHQLLEAIIREIEYQHKEDSDCVILDELLYKTFIDEDD